MGTFCFLEPEGFGRPVICNAYSTGNRKSKVGEWKKLEPFSHVFPTVGALFAPLGRSCLFGIKLIHIDFFHLFLFVFLHLFWATLSGNSYF